MFDVTGAASEWIMTRLTLILLLRCACFCSCFSIQCTHTHTRIHTLHFFARDFLLFKNYYVCNKIQYSYEMRCVGSSILVFFFCLNLIQFTLRLIAVRYLLYCMEVSTEYICLSLFTSRFIRTIIYIILYRWPVQCIFTNHLNSISIMHTNIHIYEYTQIYIYICRGERLSMCTHSINDYYYYLYDFYYLFVDRGFCLFILFIIIFHIRRRFAFCTRLFVAVWEFFSPDFADVVGYIEKKVLRLFNNLYIFFRYYLNTISCRFSQIWCTVK